MRVARDDILEETNGELLFFQIRTKTHVWMHGEGGLGGCPLYEFRWEKI